MFGGICISGSKASRKTWAQRAGSEMTSEIMEGRRTELCGLERQRRTQGSRWEGRTLAPAQNPGVWVMALPMTSCVILFSVKVYLYLVVTRVR